MRETWVRSLSWEDPLEKGKATHSSILAWKVRHNWATFTFRANEVKATQKQDWAESLQNLPFCQKRPFWLSQRSLGKFSISLIMNYLLTNTTPACMVFLFLNYIPFTLKHFFKQNYQQIHSILSWWSFYPGQSWQFSFTWSNFMVKSTSNTQHFRVL